MVEGRQPLATAASTVASITLIPLKCRVDEKSDGVITGSADWVRVCVYMGLVT